MHGSNTNRYASPLIRLNQFHLLRWNCADDIGIGVFLLGCELHVGRELAQAGLVADLFARRTQQRRAIRKILPPILPPVGIIVVVELADLIMIDTVVPQRPLFFRHRYNFLIASVRLLGNGIGKHSLFNERLHIAPKYIRLRHIQKCGDLLPRSRDLAKLF